MTDSPLENSQALPPGTRLEEFLIERVLGAGGFGITYMARDTALGRQVVIKENLPVQFAWRDPASLTVAPRHTTGEDAENFEWSLENFSNEAAMLASLDHPGIVKVLRSFEAFGTAYFVMPYVDGIALDELVRERSGKPFAEDELRGLLEHVLGALSYLHDRGIYHRDIKPGNLLITNDGVPALIDFGSARQRLSERSMTVVESAGYTPFEQLQSQGNVGPWSDLYSLGATLVKVITGEAPPKANDRMRNDPYVPLVTRTELLKWFSPGFLANIDKSLAVQEEARWQDANEWRGEVSCAPPEVVEVASVVPARLDRDVPGSTPIPAKKRFGGRVLALAACVVIGALAWMFWGKPQNSAVSQTKPVDHTEKKREQAESIAKQERERLIREEARMAEEARIREETAQAEQERLTALADEVARKLRKDEPQEAHTVQRVIPGTFFTMLCRIRENAALEAEKYYEGNNSEMREGNAMVIDRLTKALVQLVAAAYDESQLRGKTPKEFVDAKLLAVFELLDTQMQDEIEDGRNGSLGLVDLGFSKIDAVAEIIEEIVKTRLSPEDFEEWRQKWIAAGEASDDAGADVILIAEEVAPEDLGIEEGQDNFEWLEGRRVTEADVAEWDIDSLSFAINYLYARQGYPFRNPGNENLRQIFEQYSWYGPVEGMTDNQASNGMPLLTRQNMEFLAGKRAEIRGNAPAMEDPRMSLTTNFISFEDANKLTMAEIRYSINYLYARHGFPFESDKAEPIRREFARYAWYRPVPGRTMEQIDRMMNPFERQNVEILAEARKNK